MSQRPATPRTIVWTILRGDKREADDAGGLLERLRRHSAPLRVLTGAEGGPLLQTNILLEIASKTSKQPGSRAAPLGTLAASRIQLTSHVDALLVEGVRLRSRLTSETISGLFLFLDFIFRKVGESFWRKAGEFNELLCKGCFALFDKAS